MADKKKAKKPLPKKAMKKTKGGAVQFVQFKGIPAESADTRGAQTISYTGLE